MAIRYEKEKEKIDSEMKIGLEKDNYVLALKDQNIWELAKIIEIAPSNTISFPMSDVPEKNQKYYVTFIGENRRWDRYVTFQEISLDSQRIQDEKIKLDIKNEEEEKKEIKSIIFKNNEHEKLDPKIQQEHIKATRVKYIERIRFGKYETATWYFSPYPEPCKNIDILYLCEFCLSFYATEEELKRHASKCQMTHPPGNEIYRHDDKLSIWEVDGDKEPIYCENLCLLSKCFLDHKYLGAEISPFLFYILTDFDINGYHIVGYFSKEKMSDKGYNLSCILVLPFYQKKGFGKFLIAFSYELTLIEEKTGTPEVPLSDLGFRTYFSYWTQVIVKYLLEYKKDEISVKEISEHTGITFEDIYKVLERLNILRYNQGQHRVFAEKKFLENIYATSGEKFQKILRDKLHWVPYVTAIPKASQN